MAQIFHPSTNTISKVSILGGVVIASGLVGLLYAVQRSSYITQVGVARLQPVPFSHRHHVEGMGLDCRYCHTSVETGAFAGIPPTKTCMNCHSQIWSDSPMLAPVRESFRTGFPIEWTRVHDLPDFVYFDHSIHVARGVACRTCHGRVDQMPLLWRESTLHMDWCLGCHRSPEDSVGPKEHVFTMEDTPSAPRTGTTPAAARTGSALAAGSGNESGVLFLTNCSVCHR